MVTWLFPCDDYPVLPLIVVLQCDAQIWPQVPAGIMAVLTLGIAAAVLNVSAFCGQ